mmetsp:Transcript_38447/g.114060  ORF Transcript_38447/g.114060 Transcript_38447/m.114060 type:complete len:219 (-) Transcript_38447:708-1364(-)
MSPPASPPARAPSAIKASRETCSVPCDCCCARAAPASAATLLAAAARIAGPHTSSGLSSSRDSCATAMSPSPSNTREAMPVGSSPCTTSATGVPCPGAAASRASSAAAAACAPIFAAAASSAVPPPAGSVSVDQGHGPCGSRNRVHIRYSVPPWSDATAAACGWPDSTRNSRSEACNTRRLVGRYTSQNRQHSTIPSLESAAWQPACAASTRSSCSDA